MLLVFNVILYWQHWCGRTFFPFDFPLTYYASTAYWTAAVQAGEWPHWIPYEGMGFPSALNPQMGLFYPPFWILVLLRIPYTLHVAVIVQVLHILFGSIGLYFLARRVFDNNIVGLFGGFSFALFGGFFTNGEHPDIIRGFSWTPWVLLCLLSSGEARIIRVAGRDIRTTLRPPVLLLPLVIAWFICGAYPGHIVSVLLMAGLFVVAQAALRFRTHPTTVLARDAAIQLAGMGLGAVMATVFLLPVANLSGQLVRAHSWSSMARHYLQFDHVWHFLFPSNLISFPRDDFSMVGMQLPVVILLFMPFGLGRMRRVLPFLVCGICAAVMSLSVTRPISTVLISLVPALGVSRFPTGDYRLFIYLAILMIGLSGVSDAIDGTPRQWWKRAALMFCVLSLVELAAVRLGITVAPQDKAAFLRIVYLITASAILSILAFGGLLNAPPLRAVFICGLLASVVAAGYPVVQSMRQWWSEPRAEIAYYVSGGFPITHDGHLTASDIFSRQETSRPPRVEVPTPFQYAWRGYVNGTYMMNDYGPKSISQQMVDANPGVSAVMHRGTELFVANCGTVTCDADNIDGVALDTPSPDARSVVYSRNYIIYRIPVRNRSLVVENEMFAPGWSAVCESHGERLTARRVDGALRGWVLAPGTHRLRAEYRTPMLREAALVSVAAYVAWTLISGWALFILGAHRQRRRCGT